MDNLGRSISKIGNLSVYIQLYLRFRAVFDESDGKNDHVVEQHGELQGKVV
jgi:hypothetical protein